MTDADLEAMGRAAAEQIAGEQAVKHVAVSEGEDADDRPVYQFSFVIDQSLARERAGLVRIRIIQSLRDALAARDDRHLPSIRILSERDWQRLRNARSI